MLKRSWADYKDDEELPTLPWCLSVEVKVKLQINPVKSGNNKFWLLDLEEEFDKDFCIGCESGVDNPFDHTCCNNY